MECDMSAQDFCFKKTAVITCHALVSRLKPAIEKEVGATYEKMEIVQQLSRESPSQEAEHFLKLRTERDFVHCKLVVGKVEYVDYAQGQFQQNDPLIPF